MKTLVTKKLVEEMVARVLSEDCISFAQARNELGKITGRRPDRTTMHRWHRRGVAGAKLDAVRIGREFITSREAITRFIVARQTASA